MENQIDIDNQNSQPMEQNPIGQSVQVTEKPKVNYLIIGVVVFIAIALIGYFVYQNKIKLVLPSQQTTQPSISTIETIINKIAFHSGGNDFGGGDLWIMNSDGSSQKKITSTNTIEFVHGWSPDNKLLAVTLQEPNGPNKVKWSVGVVDISSGSVTKLYEPTSLLYNVDWLTNDLLVFPNEKQIETVSVSDKKHDILVKTDPNNKDVSHITLKVSPDRKWISYYYSGYDGEDNGDKNIYSFDVASRVSRVVFNSGYLRGWRGNKIVYQLNNDIWEISSDGSDKKLMLNVGEGELIELVVSSDGNKLLYQIRDYKNKPFSARLYLYDLSTGQSKEIKRIDIPDGIRNPSFSNDGQYASYYLLPSITVSQLHVYKLDTNQDSIVCDKGLPSQCSDAKWSNDSVF